MPHHFQPSYLLSGPTTLTRAPRSLSRSLLRAPHTHVSITPESNTPFIPHIPFIYTLPNLIYVPPYFLSVLCIRQVIAMSSHAAPIRQHVVSCHRSLYLFFLLLNLYFFFVFSVFTPFFLLSFLNCNYFTISPHFNPTQQLFCSQTTHTQTTYFFSFFRAHDLFSVEAPSCP